MQNHEENSGNLTPDLVSSAGINKPAFKISSLSRRNKYRQASGDFLGDQKTDLHTKSGYGKFSNGHHSEEKNKFVAGDNNLKEIDSCESSNNSYSGLGSFYSKEDGFTNIINANLTNCNDKQKHSENTERLASIGITVSKLLSSVLVHPFVVLRRQCQVNCAGRKYHLTPFTIINVAINIQSSAVQGTFCMWKGVSSSLWLFAQTIAAQSTIEAATNSRLKQDVPNNLTLLSLCEHLLLKAIVVTLTSPMYSIHVVSCVKADLNIEDETFLTCLSNSLQRVFHTGNMSSQRLIPFYKLLITTVAFQTTRYTLTLLLERIISRLMKLIKAKFYKKQNSSPRNMDCSSLQITNISPNKSKLLEVHYPQLISEFLAELITDIVLYPVETTLHRMVIQGTRIILDNTDTGSGFTSVGSKYEGFSDCWHHTVQHEGKLGLYRGFGCLMLQHCVKYLVIKTVHFGLEYLSA